jgi:hypothetical protein
MTRLLKQAFDEASRLPENEQDALARILLEEFESERRWADAFETDQDALAKLAEEALAEHRAGATELLKPDEL